jgi:hypothetical protein
MSSPCRYLHFDNIDFEQPVISSRRSQCQQEFVANPKPGERIADVLLRIPAQYEAHQCSVGVRSVECSQRVSS